jgi:excisionase family DNA binding protein
MAEAAEWLGRTPARCYQLARAGAIPVVKVGGRLVVPRAALEEWARRKAAAALDGMTSPGADRETQSDLSD